jgi:antitoxin VapB
MRLNIRSDEAHKLATELADLTGESLTSVVTVALRERLTRERRRRRPDRIAARMMKIGSRYAALADTGRSPDDILGYDAGTTDVIMVDSSVVIASRRPCRSA